ncbi:hypothetical protein BACOVA_01299 [Bacteroides ovatus ATCC 8483]|uniref:Uncharacterized protein n=1 Tax=Bacteroides ovatus (strain ATCC 8483 / DSM 1896 / JCM 5824 / BCRC 10623 / CCUG 4943 / NCTC 11153) TaxID=411476 RepID=A0AAN3AAJ3_BACO1|nr:hypothetical protein BACOVA_01299 [Bacteroides ovatus ATCC 8483]
MYFRSPYTHLLSPPSPLYSLSSPFWPFLHLTFRLMMMQDIKR